MNVDGGGDTGCPLRQGQPDPQGPLPHRLGRGSHDDVDRLDGHRGRLVLLDVVPRPTPPLRPPGIGEPPDRLARHRRRRALRHLRRRARRLARPEAGALEVVVERRRSSCRSRRSRATRIRSELDNPDKIREINAKIHISNAMIDDAIGRVMAHLDAKGWLEDTDIIFTPDHGGMDGDNGLLLIGPAMIDSITRCTMLWKPAASRNVPAADVHSPGRHHGHPGHDLRHRRCRRARLDGGSPAPQGRGRGIGSGPGPRVHAVRELHAGLRHP